jgi:hypothetical protein
MPRLVAVVAFLALAHGAAAQQVQVDYDRSKQFDGFKTYAWLDGTPMQNPLMHQRAVNAVDYHLSMKGLQRVESNPDVYVVYHAAARQELQVQQWGYRPRWGTSNIDINTIVIGTWVVDILDRDRNLLWRAVAEASVSNNPEQIERKINRAADRMFRRFPPESN